MEDCRSRYRTHILLLQTESKLCKDFWDTINNPKKVNLNLLTDDDIETYTIGERKDVIMVIYVPMGRGSKSRFILIMIFLTERSVEIMREITIVPDCK